MSLKEYERIHGVENNSKFLRNYLTKTLISAIIVFSVLILVNFSPNLKTIINDNLFKTNVNFAKINNFYKKYITGIFNKKEQIVFEETNNLKYEDYQDGVKIINNNENINLIESGIVIFIGEKENYGNTVIIQQSNGIDAWYGNVVDVKVKLYDFVEKGSILGSKNDYYYMQFQKEGKTLDYKTIIK